MLDWPFIEKVILVISILIFLLLMLYAILQFSKWIEQGRCRYWAALLGFIVTTFSLPLLVLVIVGVTAGYINEWVDRGSNPYGSIWNGEAGWGGAILLVICLYLCVFIANAAFILIGPSRPMNREAKNLINLENK